jgi:hypothetical protein
MIGQYTELVLQFMFLLWMAFLLSVFTHYVFTLDGDPLQLLYCLATILVLINKLRLFNFQSAFAKAHFRLDNTSRYCSYLGIG